MQQILILQLRKAIITIITMFKISVQNHGKYEEGSGMDVSMMCGVTQD